MVASPPICVVGVGRVSVSLDAPLNAGETGGGDTTRLACLVLQLKQEQQLLVLSFLFQPW